MSKLTGVYELLDAHAFGAALKMCDTALKKKADDDMFRAIRALCLQHLGRRDEALAACEEISGGKNLAKQPMLPQVINTLQMIYVRLGKLDRIIEIIESATKGSGDETLWQNLFHALTLRGEWGRMQQVAMKLCAKFPRQSRYFEWVVVCMLMQGGPVRALAPRMLTKCSTLTEPVDALSITGGSAEVAHRIFTERKILEADALMDGDPESAIKALKDGVRVGDRRFMVAALHGKMGNMDQCMAELAPFDGFDKVCVALDAGCDAHAIAEACSRSEHPRVRLQLRAYQQDSSNEAINEYLRTYGHEADACFHIRPFLRAAHAQSLPSLDDPTLEGTHLLNFARAHYAVWQLSRSKPQSAAEKQDTKNGGDLHFPPSLEHRVTLGAGSSTSNADVIRLYRAALCGEKEQYDEALGILEHQSQGEKEVRRSEALKLLLHGWRHDGQAMVDIWDKLEMKNVLYTSRFTALVLQWCLECNQLDKLNKIAIRTRAHLSESIRECTDSIQSCFERGPMHCIPNLYAYNRDQMCNLAHANADTILALLHVHNRPDDLAMLEEIETLDREIHDTDCGGLLQELCAPIPGFLPHPQVRTYDLPPSVKSCEQVKVHALMRPDLIHTVTRRRDELKFLRELHRRAAGMTTTTPTTTTTTATSSSATTIKNNDEEGGGVSALTNSTQRPSFDAAIAVLEEDYERVSVIFTQLVGTTPKENVEQQNGNANANENEKNENANDESLSQAVDLCVLIWAAKMLPKSKKRSSPLFASRAALKSALQHFSKEFPPRQCLKDLAFKP